MTVECLYCDEEIDIGSVGHDKSDGEVHVTLNARRGFRESWAGLGRLHVDCFHEAVGEGDFDPEEWAEKVSE